MNTPARLFNILIRVCGAGALVLGFAFWLGYARSLTQLHMLRGIGVVRALCGLAASAWRSSARGGLVAFAAAWGLLTWMLGVTQMRILPGSLHWIVQVVHLGVGMVAIALGNRLAKAIHVSR